MLAELSLLINALQSGDEAQRSDAAEKLARLGAEAQPAAVTLVEAVGREGDARDWVVAALEDLGPPPVADVARLGKLVRQEQLDTAYWAATLLGRATQAAAPAVADLAAALETHGDLTVRERAAWALGQIGPPASAAKPSLEAASKSEHARLARLAAEALQMVRG